MFRPFLIVLLAAAAVAGFSSGFHHLRGDHWSHQQEFEQHIADVCTQAALRATSTKSLAPPTTPAN
jgi:hypothetical protein